MINKKYLKATPRLDVQFLNGDNPKEILFEVKNRTAMDVGEMFVNTYVDQMIKQTIPEKELPSSVIVLVTAEFTLL